MFSAPSKFRVRTGQWGTTDDAGNNGLFMVKLRHNQTVKVVCSDGYGWEHVSVSRQDRCPTWDEMSQVKALFWGAEDCVVQFHPPESDYVNNHPYCLHLWRMKGREFERPPSLMVGIAKGSRE